MPTATQNGIEKPRAIPEASIDTKLVFDRLKSAAPGEVVSYKELADILGRDPTIGKGYSSVASARRLALNQLHFVFEAVHGVGIKRLVDKELARTGERTMQSIRRRAHIGQKKLGSVQDFDSLSRDEKTAHNAAVSILGAIRQATGSKAQAKIERAVHDAAKALPVGKTLALFGGE